MRKTKIGLCHCKWPKTKTTTTTLVPPTFDLQPCLRLSCWMKSRCVSMVAVVCLKSDGHNRSFRLCAYLCVCVFVFVFVCLCVCVFVCLCVFVFVFVFVFYERFPSLLLSLGLLRLHVWLGRSRWRVSASTSTPPPENFTRASFKLCCFH